MDSVQPKYLIPRPLRDSFDIKSRGFIKASIRAAVLAVAIFTAYKTKHPGLIALGTAVISLPATMAGVGAVCLYKGIQMIRANWATKGFQEIGNGFALVAAGYCILENYKHFSISIEANNSSYSSKLTGRGVLESYLSSLHGNWVFLD
ncbi:MAG: hypothetical protein KFB93_07220 [Simkaniaceae bacterium]|nr:MAG: hypothetical protein KFB93_07220 [Simkaniaceae bacterium]